MKKRTTTGILVAAAVFATLALSHIPAVLQCATGFLSIAAVWELDQAMLSSRKPGQLWIFAALAAAAVVIPIPHYSSLCFAAFPPAVALFAWMMVRQRQISLDRLWKTAAITLLVIFFFRAIPELRQLPGGLWYLLGAVILCFATDVAAYLIGSRFGRRKLIPSVSPNKTVAGALAGIAGAVLGMLALGALAGLWGIAVRYGSLLAYSVAASLVGQFGDLAMSSVKRICGIKDFGSLLPGHGGILDRFDSHLFCVPFTLLYVHGGGGFFL